MCSRKCASPVAPGISLREPTLYQIWMVAIGFRWSSRTRTRRPLSSVASVTGGSGEAWTAGTANSIRARKHPRRARPGSMKRVCYGRLRRATAAPEIRTRKRRCDVVIVYLALAAVLEVSGDYLMRLGLGGRRWGLIAGALALAGYGLLVNQPAWGFGRTLGLYIAIFFVVSQIIAFLAGGERPSPSLWRGGALVGAGGLVIPLGRP